MLVEMILARVAAAKNSRIAALNKKPRTWAINVDMGKPVVVNAIRRLPNGTFELLSDGFPIVPEKVQFEVGYEREKNRKVLNVMPIDPNRLSDNPHLTLQKFDLIFAIDTNTRFVDNKVISVTGIILCKLKLDNDETITVQYAPLHSLEFWNIKDYPKNAEKIGWMKSIQLMLQNPEYDPNWEIGIVVDSDLGNLPAYNARSIPIYSNFYLPQNFELIYASADVGKREYLVNRLIATSEKMAKFLLRNISQNKMSDAGLEEVSNEPYTHFRFWNVSGSEEGGKTGTVILTPYIDVKPDPHEALNNLGLALYDQARMKSGDEADALFAQAREKYATALAIKPDYQDALNNWGNTLATQAEMKNGEAADALFSQAMEKYAAALEIKPDYHQVFHNWGLALYNWALKRMGMKLMPCSRKPKRSMPLPLRSRPIITMHLTIGG